MRECETLYETGQKCGTSSGVAIGQFLHYRSHISDVAANNTANCQTILPLHVFLLRFY